MIPVYKYLPSRVNLPFLEAWENKAFSRDDDNYIHGFISELLFGCAVILSQVWKNVKAAGTGSYNNKVT